jgi:hypothetical protein
MQHQALAYRPLPHHYQMDYDWEPPITVIPDSQPEEDDWPEPLTMIPDSEDGRESGKNHKSRSPGWKAVKIDFIRPSLNSSKSSLRPNGKPATGAKGSLYTLPGEGLRHPRSPFSHRQFDPGKEFCCVLSCSGSPGPA